MLKYRPEIDGLRTVAVIPVILFHLGFDWISGGYFGVDVFFVISGFLITSIIVKEVETGTFSMKNFWLRRVRRILPALNMVLLVTLLVVPFLIFRGDLINVASDAFAAMFSYANIHAWIEFGDYWGSSAEDSFFLHTWSLSVEEQFYLFYPLMILFIYKNKLSIRKWLIGIIALSLLLFLVGSVLQPAATFYLLPTRAWELACGGLLSVIHFNKKDEFVNKYSGVLSMLGLLIILSSYFIFTGNEGVNIYAILPIVGSMLIIKYSSGSDLLGKFLSSKVMVFVGKISYSLYLWHWPVIVLFNKYFSLHYSEFYIKLISVILMVIFALLSYYLVEEKTRKWKYTLTFVPAVMVLIVVTIGLYFTSVVKKEYVSDFDKVVFYGLYYDIAPHTAPISKANESKRKDVIAPERDTKYAKSYKNGGIVTDDSANPSVLVLGDSHGAMWAKAIDEVCHENNIVAAFYTSAGNTPFFDPVNLENQIKTKGFTKNERSEYAKSVENRISDFKISSIIISCRWQSLRGVDKENFKKLLNYFKEKNIKVLLINQPPVINVIGDRNTSQYLTYLNYKPGMGLQYVAVKGMDKVEGSNKALAEYTKDYPNVRVLDVYSTLRKNTEVAVIKDSAILYYDDDHLSYQGTLLVKDNLTVAIKAIVNENK